MFKKKFLGERGSIAYFIGFVYLSVILLVLFAVVVPVLISMDTKFYAAGESILIDANATMSTLADGEVKTQMQHSLTASRNSIPEQIEVLQVFFQYGWIILIIAVVLVLFMATRRTVETGLS
jgi:hypothetical protein